MKRLILAIVFLASLGLTSCMDEREPEGSTPNDKSRNTGVTKDTVSRDNTSTMQNGGGSTNGSTSTGGGTGNGGQ